jgi:hypothetical protein
MHESLAEAVSIRYLQGTKGTFAARRRLVTDLQNGVFWMPELLAKLDAYEEQRDRYPGFQAFIPEIVEFFQDYAMKIRSKAAVARAARASLPVAVGLLGTYGILAWMPWRRRPTAKAKTRWDRIAAFASCYALLGSAFEFVVLGNRPDLPSMVAGAILLLSASLMVGRFRLRPAGTIPTELAGEGASRQLGLKRDVAGSLRLSHLLLLIGVPLLLSARFAWVFTVIAVLALLLQASTTRASDLIADGGAG